MERRYRMDSRKKRNLRATKEVFFDIIDIIFYTKEVVRMIKNR